MVLRPRAGIQSREPEELKVARTTELVVTWSVLLGGWGVGADECADVLSINMRPGFPKDFVRGR